MEEEGFGDQMDDESFMDMLRSGEEEDYVFSPTSCLSSSSSSFYSSSMLCFGAKEEKTAAAVVRGVSQKSTESSLSSLSSSPPSATITSSKSPTKKAASRGRGRGATTGTTKKPKTEAPDAPSGMIMVRKEKLGERIMALQQLVSPFGKSDTASVLHEALGYIRFLHEQVQVLSSPYLQGLPSSAHLHGERGSDLRSRGLCLVPVAYTEHVASSNGADLWSRAVGNSRGSSSAKH